MTPKEKAEELVEMFMNIRKQKLADYSIIYHPTAKQCALIVVDEIINCDSFFKTLEDTKAFTKYWYEVQQEIEQI
jgi:hypothetical protein